MHVSGSAFKLVNKRAYHHGTMLIDAKLSNLRGVLGTHKDTMVTKGVASVPSPVRNLREWSQALDHDRFVEGVAGEFARRYGTSGEIKRIDESEAEGNEYLSEVMEELESWDWMYGQTPEFTHDLVGSGAFDDLTLSIHSRHGLITSATISSPPSDATLWSAASELCQVLEGDRYGTMGRAKSYVESTPAGEAKTRLAELVGWLERAM
ncbi:SPOSA6832_00624 [Sporobolomyces salmonicolor]|uniref:Putative lipoate-protein ligase A n=1 Tax=Sporidiobolus salmonicolor TaxID=5005 RepID=A0A0D6EGQ1_SPOSA|nr:SPOSA6832_00624 [Sporobolomyces salmonicolor]